MDNFPDLSEMKRMRKMTGLSQIDIARSVNVSQSAIAKYENGSQTPSYEIAVKIFQFLISNTRKEEPTLKELMIPQIIYVKPTETLKEAIDKMKKYSISQIPVRTRHGIIVGTMNESNIVDLLSQYHSLEQFRSEEVESIMDAPLPIIPGSAKITEISAILKRFGAVLVTDFGDIVGIITKSDLLQI